MLDFLSLERLKFDIFQSWESLELNYTINVCRETNLIDLHKIPLTTLHPRMIFWFFTLNTGNWFTSSKIPWQPCIQENDDIHITKENPVILTK